MLSRLPITLAQLKAENNSEKLNEMRHLFFVSFKKKKKKKKIYSGLLNNI